MRVTSLAPFALSLVSLALTNAACGSARETRDPSAEPTGDTSSDGGSTPNSGETADAPKVEKCTIATSPSSGHLDPAFSTAIRDQALYFAATRYQAVFADDGGVFVVTGESAENNNGYTGDALVFGFDPKGNWRTGFGDQGAARIAARSLTPRGGLLQPGSAWSMGSMPTVTLDGDGRPGKIARLTSTGALDSTFDIALPASRCREIGQGGGFVAVSCDGVTPSVVLVDPSGNMSTIEGVSATFATREPDGSWIAAVLVDDAAMGIERWKDGKRVPFAGGGTRAVLPRYDQVWGIFRDDSGQIRAYGHVPSGTVNGGTTAAIWAITADGNANELTRFEYTPQASPWLSRLTRRCDGRYISVQIPAASPYNVEIRHFDPDGRLITDRGRDGVTAMTLPAQFAQGSVLADVDPKTGRVAVLGTPLPRQLAVGILLP